ncbi:MAG: dipeptidyl-peptidase 3 family protein [Prevotella sp.]|jgi:dipeptidyl-peptidase-3
MEFNYQHERFADIQMLRYQLPGWEKLSLKQKLYIYYLSKAAIAGRDITFDQFGKYNLEIRKTLETVWMHYNFTCHDAEREALHEYLRRVWFSSGIYHHYGCEKFLPGFSQKWFLEALQEVEEFLPFGESAEEVMGRIGKVMFDPDYLYKRVNKTQGEDLVKTSACNFYEGVTQEEVEHFYSGKQTGSAEEPSWGLNSKLVKNEEGKLEEQVWCRKGMYANAVDCIIMWLELAIEYAENEQQKKILRLLIDYYTNGDLRTFDKFSIEWLKEQEGDVDFINGFIEVYGDPLGLKGSWEGLVEYKDHEATKRTRLISDNAQWFEDHSPVDEKFKKKKVKGVSANVICAAMLGGDEYPSTAIGINLPNADWIRARYGSKSVSISNITHAYNEAARGNGFLEEFVIDEATLKNIRQWESVTDELHTDLHECLGHGSGQLLPGTDPNALKAYGNTIEEARADLFGLYYIADPKLMDLGLITESHAFEAQYYTYMMNGLMTQLVRIEPGHKIEEAHMLNRSLIAHWAADTNPEIVRLVERNGKHYVEISDYQALRGVFARQLAEIQRIKSEGDYNAARNLVERYAVNVEKNLHTEVRERYQHLHIAPYKGFLNPKLTLVEEKGKPVDVKVSYDESYDEQMLRYSRDYASLI